MVVSTSGYRRSERRSAMSFRKYSLAGYDEMRARHRWEVPDRYNIARDVCDKHDRERLAMVWESTCASSRSTACRTCSRRPPRCER